MPLFLWSCFIDLCLFFWGSFSSDHRAIPIKKPREVVDTTVKSPAGLWNFRGIRDKSPNLLPPSLTPLLFLPCTLSPEEGISLWWEPDQFSLPHQESFFPSFSFSLHVSSFFFLHRTFVCRNWVKQMHYSGRRPTLLGASGSWLFGWFYPGHMLPFACAFIYAYMQVCS